MSSQQNARAKCQHVVLRLLAVPNSNTTKEGVKSMFSSRKKLISANTAAEHCRVRESEFAVI